MRNIFYYALLAGALLGFAEKSFARDTIRVGYPAPAGAFLPIWAANDAGFFKKHRVPMEVIATGSSSRAIASMLAGDLDILAGGGTGGVTTQLKGYKDLALFGNVINRFVFSVYAHPSITAPAQLRGKKMGVTQFGGTLDFAARQYVKSVGLEPVKDVAFIQIGRMPDIVAAMLGGSIDAGTIGVPQNLIAKKQGFRELSDLSQMNARYALSALLAKRSFLESNHAHALNFMRALTEAIYFLKTRPKEGMEIFGRYTRITDPEVLKPAYDLHIKLFPKVPEILPEDLRLVLEEISATQAEAKQANPADFIDDRITKELIKSGFADQLYK